MKIPPLHYATILLLEDFNLNPSQVAERLDLSLRYVYFIRARYQQIEKLQCDFQYETKTVTHKKRMSKYE